MTERRTSERFHIHAAAMFSVRDGGRKSPSRVVPTRDISTGGAFLLCTDTCDPGTTLDIMFLLTVPDRRSNKFHQALYSVSGEIVRTTAQGMAVTFTRQGTLSALDAAAAQSLDHAEACV